MSTNFYIRKINIKACTHCGRDDDYEEIHLGKRSGGWQFSFNSYKSSAKEWKEFLNDNKDNIYDEYNKKVFISEILDIIETKGLNGKTATVQQYGGFPWKDHEYFDEEGYRFIKAREFC